MSKDSSASITGTLQSSLEPLARSPFCLTSSTIRKSVVQARLAEDNPTGETKVSTSPPPTGRNAFEVDVSFPAAVKAVSTSRLDPNFRESQHIDLEDDEEEQDFDGIDQGPPSLLLKTSVTRRTASNTSTPVNGEDQKSDLELTNLPLATLPLAKDVEAACANLIHSLKIPSLDGAQAKQLEVAASRMARLYLTLLSGLYVSDPFTENVSDVTNQGLSSQVLGPVGIQTICRQHMLPIYGTCTISIIRPLVIKGTTKYLKYIRWLTSRPWIQEDLGTELANRICFISGAQKVEVALSLEQVSLENGQLVTGHKVLTRHTARSNGNQAAD